MSFASFMRVPLFSVPRCSQGVCDQGGQLRRHGCALEFVTISETFEL